MRLSGSAKSWLPRGVPKGSVYRYFAACLRDMDERLPAPGASATERLMSLFSHWHHTQSGDDLQARYLMVKLSAEVCDLSESMRAAMAQGCSQTLSSHCGRLRSQP